MTSLRLPHPAGTGAEFVARQSLVRIEQDPCHVRDREIFQGKSVGYLGPKGSDGSATFHAARDIVSRGRERSCPSLTTVAEAFRRGTANDLATLPDTRRHGARSRALLARPHPATNALRTRREPQRGRSIPRAFIRERRVDGCTARSRAAPSSPDTRQPVRSRARSTLARSSA